MKPLQGKTVLVTRSRAQASDLSRQIEALGGRPMEFPLIQLEPPRDLLPVQQALKEIHQFDWILFTSTNGVEFFVEQVQKAQLEFSHITARVGVVGPKTAEILKRMGKVSDLVAAEFKAEGLLESLQGVLQPGDRVLLPRANIARDILPRELRARGMNVTEIVVYETVISSDGADQMIEMLQSGQIDIITFTSSSTVRNFCELLRGQNRDKLLAKAKIACIGPITAETAEKLGLKVDRVATDYTIDGLVQVLTKL
ncbi:uroporphyrinogen-III synthase [Ammoniphilus sp. YIM 78166]|uniref:uroporphyrinogen-III synthase n=1 Tax=Ammoniphilus sp. YIM 78166 TaxID=1644106 RepID=UPI00142F6FB8|nr:uroporphyrinogen-III synthase [Ammoniphilus sp. YIM 78166]